MKRFGPVLLAAALFTSLCDVTCAFNALGHSVISKIAYDKLNSEQRDAIHNVLKQHPHYAEYLVAERPEDIALGEWSFIRASTWADWVRSHHSAQYHKGSWHYVNYPYTMGQATTSLGTALPQPQNIRERLPLAIKVIGNGGATNELGLLDSLSSAERKAVALTWMFHFVGDFHQPLHVVALVDEVRFPAAGGGDQGGNKIAVLVGSGAKPTKLHSYWDGVLGDNAEYDNIADVAETITHNPPFSASELAALAADTDLDAWALDGFKLAAKHCYLDGTLVLSPWLADYDRGGTAAADVPRLNSTVKKEARRIYRQRLLLAGERLAQQFKLLFP